MEALTEEIQQVSNDCKETKESRERRNTVRRLIKGIVNEIYPDADVIAVGSCGNGFGTKNSDLDLTIISSTVLPYDHAVIKDLWMIEKKMKSNQFSYKDIEVVTNAHVPIIRFKYHCELETLPCDISVNRRNNIFNTVLLTAYSQLDDRVKPLILALKTWGKTSRVIDSRNNRLASFTLSLMVINYLQSGCHPSVLPSLQTTHPIFFNTSAKNVDAITRYINDPLPQTILSFNSTNTKSIGELFAGFLEHYCSFNWGRDGISVRSGSITRRPLKRGSNNTCLFVEDPYEVSSNTARGVYKELIWRDITGKFKTARDKLKNGKSFNDIL